MTRVQWHQPGDKIFQDGLDQGMLYVEQNPGVPWNGLTQVSEKSNNKVSPVHFDGIKYNDLVTFGNFSGTINAFTYPDEFFECEGVLEDQQGIFVSDQNLSRFGMSYRTLVNDPNDSSAGHYKLHLLYNLTAIPKATKRKTLAFNPDPTEFEWAITSIPENLEGYRPTSHVIIDSRQVDPLLMEDLEDLLYGSETDIPQLPSLQGLMNFIRKWERLVITDNGDGTWTATSTVDGTISMVSETEFSIIADNVVWNDPPDNTSYDISSSDKNVEDL